MAIETRNPATGEVLKTFEPLADDEVDERIARAAAAAASYRATTFAERAGWARAAADLLDAEVDSVAAVMTTEMGKTLRAAKAEATKCATVLRFYAEHAERTRTRVEGLKHHIGAILREFNRRSQLTPQQRAHEHSIREGRAQAKIAGTVQRARRHQGRTSHPGPARGPGRRSRTSNAA